MVITAANDRLLALTMDGLFGKNCTVSRKPTWRPLSAFFFELWSKILLSSVWMIIPTCSTYVLMDLMCHKHTYEAFYSEIPSPHSGCMTRGTKGFQYLENNNNFIGTHYAANMHTFEKLTIPKTFRPQQFLWNDVTKERSTTKTAFFFSQESIAHLQTAFTL